MIAAVSEFGYHETTISQIGGRGRSLAAHLLRLLRGEGGVRGRRPSTRSSSTSATRLAAATPPPGEGGPSRVAARLDAALAVFATNPSSRLHPRRPAPRRRGVTARYRRRPRLCACRARPRGCPTPAGRGPAVAGRAAGADGGIVSLIVEGVEAGGGEREPRSASRIWSSSSSRPFIGRAEAGASPPPAEAPLVICRRRAERPPRPGHDGSQARPFAEHRLPPGHHGLTPETVAENQRWRLLGAVAEELAERGHVEHQQHPGLQACRGVAGDLLPALRGPRRVPARRLPRRRRLECSGRSSPQVCRRSRDRLAGSGSSDAVA